MKKKYDVSKNHGEQQYILKEFSEMEQGVYTLMCEASYGAPLIDDAVAKGKTILIDTFRNHNIYPPANCTDQIADALIALAAKEEDETIELFFNDLDYIVKEEVEEDGDDVEIETLLEDEDSDSDEFMVDDEIKTIDSDVDTPTIKVADDDGGLDGDT